MQTATAPLIALIGAKGGVGTSFVACQLAASLARLGERTALVDGHMRHGDVALYLDLSPQYTFSRASRAEASPSTPPICTPPWRRTRAASRYSPPRSARRRPTRVGVSCVEGVVGLVRTEFDWVIWDTPQDFDDRSLFILDQADTILLITTPDVPAMNHTRMQLELLERLGHSDGKIRIAVNRTERKASVSMRDAKEFLDRPVDASIPNDYRRASACLNEGRTLHDVAPRSALADSHGRARDTDAHLVRSIRTKSAARAVRSLERKVRMALLDRLKAEALRRHRLGARRGRPSDPPKRSVCRGAGVAGAQVPHPQRALRPPGPVANRRAERGPGQAGRRPGSATPSRSGEGAAQPRRA